MGKRKKPMLKLKWQSGKQWMDQLGQPALTAQPTCHGQKHKQRVVSNFNGIPSILLSLSEAVILSSKR